MTTTSPSPTMLSPAAFRCLRERLGMSRQDVAHLCNVQERTVQRWDEGGRPIPQEVVVGLLKLQEYTLRTAQNLQNTLAGVPQPRAITYRTNADFLRDHPTSDLSAGWHRAMVGRVAERLPTLEIVYAG